MPPIEQLEVHAFGRRRASALRSSPIIERLQPPR